MNQEQTIAARLLLMLIFLGKLSEAHDLVSPIEVDAVDQDGKVWNFSFSDDFDPDDVLFANPTPPIFVRLTDANGRSVGQEIMELEISPVQ